MRKRDKLIQELQITNGYLAEIAETLQSRPYIGGLERTNAQLSLIAEIMQREKEFPKTAMRLPQPVVDASELLARWLWLHLPEASKEDIRAPDA